MYLCMYKGVGVLTCIHLHVYIGMYVYIYIYLSVFLLAYKSMTLLHTAK